MVIKIIIFLFVLYFILPLVTDIYYYYKNGYNIHDDE